MTQHEQDKMRLIAKQMNELKAIRNIFNEQQLAMAVQVILVGADAFNENRFEAWLEHVFKAYDEHPIAGAKFTDNIVPLFGGDATPEETTDEIQH